MKTEPLIFSLSSSVKLAEGVASHLGLSVSPSKLAHFADQEIFAKPLVDVSNRDCIIIQSTCKPVNDRLMEVLVFADSLKNGGAKTITLIAPYFGYVRQDRVIDYADPVSSALVARCMKASGINRVVCVDYHSKEMAPFFKDMEAVNLASTTSFKTYFEGKMKELNITSNDIVVISPDKGGVGRATRLSEALGNTPLAIMNKFRPAPNVAEITSFNGAEVNGKVCIMIDDMIDTGGTIVAASKELLKSGARGIMICATHGIFSRNALARLFRCGILDIAITDSIAPEEDVVSVVSLDNLIANYIKENY